MNCRKNENASELRAKAVKYREMARMTTDLETARRILELTEELEREAHDIDAREPD